MKAVWQARAAALERRIEAAGRDFSLRLVGLKDRIAALSEAGGATGGELAAALERQRRQLRAEHAIDRKVWAVEQAETRRYIDSILDWARNSETYAKSLEQEVERLKNYQRAEWDALARALEEARARVAALERAGVPPAQG